MDKSIKINLAGSLFQIDEEAYQMLRDYLQSINVRLKNFPGGNETIDDIESRIAEIFQSQRGTAGIITKENVEGMIGIIGKPEDFETGESAWESAPGYSKKRRLYRNPDDSIIAGVCGGIGAYMNIDPVWIRLIFILFTFSFGIGLFIYLALWIALPSAFSDPQKRELFGDSYHSEAYKVRQSQANGSKGATNENYPDNNVGNGVNEIFRAIWKALYIFIRVFAVIIGVMFVIMGFALLLAFIMILFFRNPGFLSSGFNGNLFYLPDFLDFVVDPVLTPWISVLAFLVVFLPLMAIIYWGIKMIFWFRSRDGIISLIALILWVLSITALSIIAASEGLSFAETGRVSATVTVENAPKTVYIITGARASDLKYDREINLPDNSYSVFANNETKELSFRVKMRLYTSEDNSVKLEINKKSEGKARLEATRKAESLIYNYSFVNDTVKIDEYFTLPKDQKWSADEVSVSLYVPVGTILYFDDASENIMSDHIHINGEHYYETDPWVLGGNYWIITEDRLEKTSQGKKTN